MSQFLISPEDEHNFEALKAILQDADNPTVAFVGSGMSRPNGYASWETLVDRLASLVSITDHGHDVREFFNTIEKARQSYGQKFRDTADAHFRAAIRQCLIEANHQLTHSSHHCLVRINFSAFLTTNFDPSIGIAAGLDPIRKCHSIPYRLDVPFDSGYLRLGGIYYIHGCLWDQEMNEVEDPIVFLNSEYEVAYGSPERPGENSKFLDPVFRNYNIVFIGFGMRDPAFMVLMERVRQMEAYRALAKLRRSPGKPIGPKQLPHWFSIAPLPEDDEYAREQCALDHSKNGPFTVIHYKYSKNDGKQSHWGLHELLEELSKSCPYMGQFPKDATVVTSFPEAAQLEPPTMPSPAVPSLSHSEPEVHIHTQITEDFNQILDRVDAVLRQDDPPDQDIDWVISQMSEPAILDFTARILTDHLDLLKRWFPVFFSARLLSAPPYTIREGVGDTDPYWYAGPLLITAASQGHPLIETVLRSFKDVGPNAKLLLLRAFIEIRDIELVASLVPAVRGWLASGLPSLFDYVVPGLGSQVISLLRAGHEVQAAELLDVMLEHKNKDIDPQRFGLAESVVSQFWVNYLVTHILPDLSKVNPSWLVIVLESKLRQVAEWELGNNPGYSPPEFLRAPGFMPPIDEAGGDHSPFPDQLVGALRDAVDALISSDTDQAEQLITRWLGERMLVFRRLAFHLLAKHGDLLGECRQHAVRQENLSLTGCRYEYREFLKSQFRQLPEDQQRQIENWILAL